MNNIKVIETRELDLDNVLTLWADGDVMKFVGFPNGLHETKENIIKWYQRINKVRPYTNHFSIYNGDVYCGETFYSIDQKCNNIASLDIKIFKHARGKGFASFALQHAIDEAFKNGASKVWVDPNPNNVKAIALYERLGFVRKPMPDYLIEEEGNDVVYMEMNDD